LVAESAKHFARVPGPWPGTYRRRRRRWRSAAALASRGPCFRACATIRRRCFGGMRRQMSIAVRTTPTGPILRVNTRRRRGTARILVVSPACGCRGRPGLSHGRAGPFCPSARPCSSLAAHPCVCLRARPRRLDASISDASPPSAYSPRRAAGSPLRASRAQTGSRRVWTPTGRRRRGAGKGAPGAAAETAPPMSGARPAMRQAPSVELAEREEPGAPALGEAEPPRRRRAPPVEGERAGASGVAWRTRPCPVGQAMPPRRPRARIQRRAVRRSASRHSPFPPTMFI
jgi:hypothetical protein